MLLHRAFQQGKQLHHRSVRHCLCWYDHKFYIRMNIIVISYIYMLEGCRHENMVSPIAQQLQTQYSTQALSCLGSCQRSTSCSLVPEAWCCANKFSADLHLAVLAAIHMRVCCFVDQRINIRRSSDTVIAVGRGTSDLHIVVARCVEQCNPWPSVLTRPQRSVLAVSRSLVLFSTVHVTDAAVRLAHSQQMSK